jgi:hypothetical protein
MARGLRILGTIGAVFLLVGVVIVGVGVLYLATTQNASANCSTNCPSANQNLVNASTNEGYFIGAGIILGGVGLGLVIAVAIQFMSRWPPMPSRSAGVGYPPPAPPPAL